MSRALSLLYVVLTRPKPVWHESSYITWLLCLGKQLPGMKVLLRVVTYGKFHYLPHNSKLNVDYQIDTQLQDFHFG